MLVFLDLRLDLSQHRDQLAPVIWQLIDNEVIIIDILAILLTHLLIIIRTLDLISGPFGPSPLCALKRLLEVLLLFFWLRLNKGGI